MRVGVSGLLFSNALNEGAWRGYVGPICRDLGINPLGVDVVGRILSELHKFVKRVGKPAKSTRWFSVNASSAELLKTRHVRHYPLRQCMCAACSAP